MDYFKALETFVSVNKLGSLSAAAKELSLSRAMISKSLADLESHVGVRLINRTTRRISLTEAGAEFYVFATRILQEISEQERFLSTFQKRTTGSLKILSPESFGSIHLAKAIAEFCLRHPDIKATLILETPSSRELDFTTEYDIAIRVIPLSGMSVVARTLASLPWAICASPQYIHNHGHPERPEDLLQHNCLLHSEGFPHRNWKFGDVHKGIELSVGGTFAANSLIVLRDAAIEGLGIALLPVYACKDAIQSGRLIRLLPSHTVPDTPLCALIPSNRFIPEKVKAMLDFLSAWAAREL